MKNPYRYIRLGRQTVAAAVATIITLCVALGLRCAATRMQIIPAVMAGSAAWLLLWALATMVLGRIYCSAACPAGALMDALARIRQLTDRLLGRCDRHYHYRAPSTRARYAILVAVAACMAIGFAGVATLLDPYSAFARIVALPAAAVRSGALSLLSAAVASATLCAIAAFSWRRGRYLCNTWCPVGSALSIVSKRALYHPDVNTDLCTHCRRCVDACKASCINPDDMTVDSARCVVCFNCMDACPNDAITYTRFRHRLATPLMQPTAAASGAVRAASGEPVLMDRRKFLRLGIVAATAAVAAKAGGETREWDPQPLEPLNTPLPPGAESRKSFLRRCTACAACIAACPTGVLAPAEGATRLLHSLQPAMRFGSRACAADCNACTQVCPTGALTPLTLSEKRRFAIGKARVRLQNCLAYGKGRTCGRCARRCPTGAMKMTLLADGRRGPVVDLETCTGCGQCVLACPSAPYKAITIEGI